MLLRSFRSYSASPKKVPPLGKPRFDVKNVIAQLESYRESCLKRNVGGVTIANLQQIEPLYEKFTQLDKASRNLKHERNVLDLAVMNQREARFDLGKVYSKLSDLKPKIKQLEQEIDIVNGTLLEKIESLPNLCDKSVSETEQLMYEIKGRSPTETNDHKQIGEELGILNFASASRISGSSFYYLLGDGALLEQALVQYSLKLARQNGFSMVVPPSLVKFDSIERCGFKPRDKNEEKQIYKVEGEDLCLAGTAEIPMAGLYANEIFSEKELPRRHVGVSRSYRSEAGAHGKDTKGLYRVHEFTKVELFSWTTNDLEESGKEFDRIVSFQKSFIESLGLSAKVLNMPFHDLGAPAYRKVDIECYMPGRGKYGEVSSCSNCTDYQSRRLNTRFADVKSGKNEFVHTLNGTAVAVPRVVLAIIENFYDPITKSIEIPEVLKPFMDGKQRIE